MGLIVAGERSGVGKTTVTLALLAYLCKIRGVEVQSFKVGPDYIDPMFHRYVTGRACRNLDPVLTSEAYVKKCFIRHAQECEYALVEGVMGLFDGIGQGEFHQYSVSFASTAHIAKLLNLPILLVIDCSRLSGSAAAIAYGYSHFDPTINIAGVVLNRVGSDRHLSLLKDSLVPLEIPILGVVRRHSDIAIGDRHLGLIPTDELPQLDSLIAQLADVGEKCFDWNRLLPMLGGGGEGVVNSSVPSAGYGIKIAVACDRAFNFYYQDNLDLLQDLGAELVFWSPMEESLPLDVWGMYFGGGFPEVFAQQLAENIEARDAVKTAILGGIPTIAECGGLMYLCEQIVDMNGKSWPMTGVLPTSAVMDRLTLGYRRAVALQDSLLVDAGTIVCGHEFHRSRLISMSDKPLFQTYRFESEESTGYDGWSLPNLHASYIHQHWGEYTEIPQRFLDCVNWKRRGTQGYALRDAEG